MAKRKISSKLPIQEALGVVAGAIAAALVGKAITAAMPNTKPAIKALIPVGLGIFLAGMKSPIIKGAGFGMIAKGGSSLVEAFTPAGFLGGDEFLLSSDYNYLNAPADQSILSAPADQSILSEYYMNGESMDMDEVAMMNGSDESEF
jgi:hypothetical protein